MTTLSRTARPPPDTRNPKPYVQHLDSCTLRSAKDKLTPLQRTRDRARELYRRSAGSLHVIPTVYAGFNVLERIDITVTTTDYVPETLIKRLT